MTQNVEQLVQGTMESYYEYVVKIGGGCATIANAFENNDVGTGVQGIQGFSEGLSWLVEAENLLQLQSYQISNSISQVIALLEKVNDALQATKYQEVGRLFEEEVQPLFEQANEWRFEKIIS